LWRDVLRAIRDALHWVRAPQTAGVRDLTSGSTPGMWSTVY
jgi:hypothetical protein